MDFRILQPINVGDNYFNVGSGCYKMIIKQYKERKTDIRLKGRNKDGILIHGYVKYEYFKDKIGLSMNDRMHFTKDEWKQLYTDGLQMFKRVEDENV